MRSCRPAPAPIAVEATGELFVCLTTGEPWSTCTCEQPRAAVRE